jgi:hypothetical protein
MEHGKWWMIDAQSFKASLPVVFHPPSTMRHVPLTMLFLFFLSCGN